MKNQTLEIKQELSILCALLTGQVDMGDVYPRLKGEHFGNKANAFVYNAVTNLYNNGIAMDFTLLEEEMRRMDPEYFNEINGIDAVREGFASVLDGSNASMYADHIIESYQRRKLYMLTVELQAKCGQFNIPMPQLLKDGTKKLQLITEVGVDNSTIRQVSQIGDEVIAKHKQMLEQGVDAVGFSTGLKGLDKVIGGLIPGEVPCIGARPGQGKSALALFIALSVARTGHPVYFITLEMSLEQLYGRILLSLTEVSADNLRQHGLTIAEIEAVKSLNESTLKELPLYIDFISSARVEDIRAKVKLARNRNQCDFVVIDYLHQMEVDEEGNKNNHATVLGNTMKRIKNLAVEENIPIMVLSQLNREIEKRTDDSKPKMTDLRDSGVLEQAADIVMIINRPETQGKVKDVNGESLAGIGFISIIKNRNGSTGMARFRYNSNMTRLSDY